MVELKGGAGAIGDPGITDTHRGRVGEVHVGNSVADVRTIAWEEDLFFMLGGAITVPQEETASGTRVFTRFSEEVVVKEADGERTAQLGDVAVGVGDGNVPADSVCNGDGFDVVGGSDSGADRKRDF